MPDAAVRFEICINDQPLATIGLEDCGVLTALVSRVRRSPARITEAHRQQPGFDEAEFLQDRCELSMSGLDSGRDLHWHWGSRALAPGDVVTVRVLPAGPCDPPQQVQTDGAGPPR
ncbi:hypothetical protein KAK07_19445 [Ideonella sp. 4Y16]|uniref:Uncharacterized protein n=1 Tax=Ideonella alba TaxID=2824118 RepID=A0A940YB00_9BURK|nr:hypothetical protein [Ideonella alba]MBQ0929412.1 hypothetical protein [Ideonella alba]MBQ0945523.1 hypothetical protein [Ideonella alba]